MSALRCHAVGIRRLQVTLVRGSHLKIGGPVYHQSRGLVSTQPVEEASSSKQARAYQAQKPDLGTPRPRTVKRGPPVGADALKGLITIKDHGSVHPSWLRDCCPCPRCVDPSTRQKNFQTTDIPADIEAASIETLPETGVQISWKNDIPGYGPDHISTFSGGMLRYLGRSRPPFVPSFRSPWSKDTIARELQFFDYESYMSEKETLFRALVELSRNGLLLIRNVPDTETAVEAIGSRIGNLRDTFYGRTWDVKSVANARNVAYTSQYLGLHMDLLYMSDPPGFQLLHCLKNTCDGGLSLFSDAEYAAGKLDDSSFFLLASRIIPYHYLNAGEHYQHNHPVIELRTTSEGGLKKNRRIKHINWSPPFQHNFRRGNTQAQAIGFPKFLKALQEFANLVEAPENVFEYRLQEGECVIFNNRRILHGRKGFDNSTGERWLKGAYVDTSVFRSRFRVLVDEIGDSMDADSFREAAQFVSGPEINA